MEVITIDSEAYQKLVTQLNRIEGFIERMTGLYCDIEENLELTSKEVTVTLGISLATLYRWRQDGTIRYRYLKNGEIRYPYRALYSAIRHSHLRIPGISKEEGMRRLNRFKDDVIINGIAYNDVRNGQ